MAKGKKEKKEKEEKTRMRKGRERQGFYSAEELLGKSPLAVAHYKYHECMDRIRSMPLLWLPAKGDLPRNAAAPEFSLLVHGSRSPAIYALLKQEYSKHKAPFC